MAVKKGNKIKVDYEGKFENGEVFDSSSKSGHSLEFVAGNGMVIPGFDNAVIGMDKDEEKEITIEKKEGYGDYKEDLKKDVPKETLPKEPEPKEGMMLVMNTPDGHQIPAKIAKVNKDTITLDLNHPLAGKKLIFKIKIKEIESNSK